jgi:hypothetical protein
MKTLSKILLSTLLFSAVMSSDGYGMAPVPNNGDSKTTKKNFIDNNWAHFTPGQKQNIVRALYGGKNNTITTNTLNVLNGINGVVADPNWVDLNKNQKINSLNQENRFVNSVINFSDQDLLDVKNGLNIVNNVSADGFELAIAHLRGAPVVPVVVPGDGVGGHLEIVHEGVMQQIIRHVQELSYKQRICILVLILVFCSYEGWSIFIPSILLIIFNNLSLNRQINFCRLTGELVLINIVMGFVQCLYYGRF